MELLAFSIKFPKEKWNLLWIRHLKLNKTNLLNSNFISQFFVLHEFNCFESSIYVRSSYSAVSAVEGWHAEVFSFKTILINGNEWSFKMNNRYKGKIRNILNLLNDLRFLAKLRLKKKSIVNNSFEINNLLKQFYAWLNSRSSRSEKTKKKPIDNQKKVFTKWNENKANYNFWAFYYWI